jgi:PHP family Zn ribbon phosphoesterase
MLAGSEKPLRLDLHTHIWEATGCAEPTPDIVRRVVEVARSRGLDGIAVTEHNYPEYGLRFKQLADRCLEDHFLIIPGQEIDQYSRNRQIVELYLPGGVTFRFLAHPGQPEGSLDGDLSDLHGIELCNAVHDWHIQRDRVLYIAQQRGLLLLAVSDAHRIEHIGRVYTSVSLEELCSRAKGIL